MPSIDVASTNHTSPVGKESKSDPSSVFLRAAKFNDQEQVASFLKDGININSSNQNGLNALHLAAKEGHNGLCEFLLNRGIDMNASTKKGNTAVHIASLGGKLDIVKLLVERGAKVNITSQQGFTPLYMAAQENHADVVKYLLSKGADQRLTTEDGYSPQAVAQQQGHARVVAILLENDNKGNVRLPALHVAARKDDLRAAALLLQNGDNADIMSGSGFTPLHIAAHYGHARIGELLISYGAKVGVAAKNNITPMHVAAKWGKSNMIECLIEHGADVNCKTKDNLTPLHCSSRGGHVDVVDLLLATKATDVKCRTKSGLTALHMTAQGDHVPCSRLLLFHGINVNEITRDLLTPLHVSAHCGSYNNAKYLLEKDANPDCKAMNGFTALHIAVKKRRIQIILLLLNFRASVNQATETGLSPLHIAAYLGFTDCVEELRTHDAKINLITERGETPLHLAVRANHYQVAETLIKYGADINAQASEKQTCLHIIARLGNVDMCDLFLEHKADVNAVAMDGYLPLHVAVKEGHTAVAKKLLDSASPIDAKTHKEFTPLHLAAKYNQWEAAHLLLERNADPDAPGKNNLTPLHIAVHYGHSRVAKTLLNYNASPLSQALNGYTPLHIAAKKNNVDIGEELIKRKAKVNAQTKSGGAPMHLAAKEGHVPFVRMLVSHDADPEIVSSQKVTPLHMTAQEDRLDVCMVLVEECKVNRESPTTMGFTPLLTAIFHNNIRVAKYLMKMNANPNAQTLVDGYNGLHLATQQGNTQMVKLLLENNTDPNALSKNGATPEVLARKLNFVAISEILGKVTHIRVTMTIDMEKELRKTSQPETITEGFLEEEEQEDEIELEDSHMLESSFLDPQDIKFITDDSIGNQTLDRTSTSSFGNYATYTRFLNAGMSSRPTSGQSNISCISSTSYGEVLSERFNKLSVSELRTMPGFYPDNAHANTSQNAGFLISFVVDAKGCTMRGGRHSGMRFIIPPKRCERPMRLTCRYVRKSRIHNPPPLFECEGLAARILEMSPVGAQFLGPVILEIPHFASLRNNEREVVILKSENGVDWVEHLQDPLEKVIEDALNISLEKEDEIAQSDLNTDRIVRIVTKEFPQYFALVTRLKKECRRIGPSGGIITSSVEPRIQVSFPQDALKKVIPIAVQVLNIPNDVVRRYGDSKISCSSVITIEPRRRKFHRSLTITLPLPRGGETQLSVRLLRSVIAGAQPSEWTDCTSSNSLTLLGNGVCSFTTAVSARFWLIECHSPAEAESYARQIYSDAISVPYMAKFVVFAKRHAEDEARLRVFCMTDDKSDKTLESQEQFIEIARSRDFPVEEKKIQWLEWKPANLFPVLSTGEQLQLNFFAFRENRLQHFVRVRDTTLEPLGRVGFFRNPKPTQRSREAEHENNDLICSLNIELPPYEPNATPGIVNFASSDLRRRHTELCDPGLSPNSSYERAMLRLGSVADQVGPDWELLAARLGVDSAITNVIRAQLPDDVGSSGRAYRMLHHWAERAGMDAKGSSLAAALKDIGRDDVNTACLGPTFRVSSGTEDFVAEVENSIQRFRKTEQEASSVNGPLKLSTSHDLKAPSKGSPEISPSGQQAHKSGVKSDGDRTRKDNNILDTKPQKTEDFGVHLMEELNQMMEKPVQETVNVKQESQLQSSALPDVSKELSIEEKISTPSFASFDKQSIAEQEVHSADTAFHSIEKSSSCSIESNDDFVSQCDEREEHKPIVIRNHFLTKETVEDSNLYSEVNCKSILSEADSFSITEASSPLGAIEHDKNFENFPEQCEIQTPYQSSVEKSLEIMHNSLIEEETKESDIENETPSADTCNDEDTNFNSASLKDLTLENNDVHFSELKAEESKIDGDLNVSYTSETIENDNEENSETEEIQTNLQADVQVENVSHERLIDSEDEETPIKDTFDQENKKFVTDSLKEITMESNNMPFSELKKEGNTFNSDLNIHDTSEIEPDENDENVNDEVAEIKANLNREEFSHERKIDAEDVEATLTDKRNDENGNFITESLKEITLENDNMQFSVLKKEDNTLYSDLNMQDANENVSDENDDKVNDETAEVKFSANEHPQIKEFSHERGIDAEDVETILTDTLDDESRNFITDNLKEITLESDNIEFSELKKEYNTLNSDLDVQDTNESVSDENDEKVSDEAGEVQTNLLENPQIEELSNEHGIDSEDAEIPLTDTLSDEDGNLNTDSIKEVTLESDYMHFSDHETSDLKMSYPCQNKTVESVDEVQTTLHDETDIEENSPECRVDSKDIENYSELEGIQEIEPTNTEQVECNNIDILSDNLVLPVKENFNIESKEGIFKANVAKIADLELKDGLDKYSNNDNEISDALIEEENSELNTISEIDMLQNSVNDIQCNDIEIESDTSVEEPQTMEYCITKEVSDEALESYEDEISETSDNANELIINDSNSDDDEIFLTRDSPVQESEEFKETGISPDHREDILEYDSNLESKRLAEFAIESLNDDNEKEVQSSLNLLSTPKCQLSSITPQNSCDMTFTDEEPTSPSNTQIDNSLLQAALTNVEDMESEEMNSNLDSGNEKMTESSEEMINEDIASASSPRDNFVPSPRLVVDECSSNSSFDEENSVANYSSRTRTITRVIRINEDRSNQVYVMEGTDEQETEALIRRAIHDVADELNVSDVEANTNIITLKKEVVKKTLETGEEETCIEITQEIPANSMPLSDEDIKEIVNKYMSKE